MTIGPSDLVAFRVVSFSVKRRSQSAIRRLAGVCAVTVFVAAACNGSPSGERGTAHDPSGASLVTSPRSGPRGDPASAVRSLVPFAGGSTNIGYNDGTLSVEAGEPGSITIVATPGQATVGRPVRCTWHDIGGTGYVVTWNPNEPVVPEAGGFYILVCIHPDDDTSLVGYPRVVEFTPADPIPGGAVGTVEIAKFAVDSIAFQTPIPALSPPGRQIVGVETWLGVASRLSYRDVSAQAGNTWVTVRPALRGATWTLGDGSEVTCTADVATVWNPDASPEGQSTSCSHVFESASGPHPFAGRVDVSWTIYELTDLHPNTWTLWGIVTRSASVGFPVGELQSVIR